MSCTSILSGVGHLRIRPLVLVIPVDPFVGAFIFLYGLLACCPCPLLTCCNWDPVALANLGPAHESALDCPSSGLAGSGPCRCDTPRGSGIGRLRWRSMPASGEGWRPGLRVTARRGARRVGARAGCAPVDLAYRSLSRPAGSVGARGFCRIVSRIVCRTARLERFIAPLH